MPSHSVWLDRYRRRYQWALGAYDGFVRSLDPELAQSLRRNEQVSVAVYGVTQVGKTSLILELLGLSALTTEEPGRVLRGGQALGKSATALPLRYRRSADDHWCIGGQQPLSADEARDQLASLRRDMEQGRAGNLEVLDIRIPRRLFPPEVAGKATPELTILDIPGINARNDHEQERVAALALRYVAVADLVLLVGSVNSLGFLNPSNLNNEALASWGSQPARFRIVLTFAYSQDSFYRQFRDQPLTPELVRDTLMVAMNGADDGADFNSGFEYRVAEEFRNRLYPLELGDSLTKLAATDRPYAERITALNGQFRQQLLDDIHQAAGPYGRLAGAFQLDRVIHSRLDSLQQQRHAEETRCDEERALCVKALRCDLPQLHGYEPGAELMSELQRLAAEATAELAEHEQQLKALQQCQERLAKHSLNEFFAVRLKPAREETVSFLQGELARCEAEQRDALRRLPNLLLAAGLLPEWCADEAAPTLAYRRDPLLSVETTLDGHWLDSYWISSNFEDDRNTLRQALREVTEDLCQRLKRGLSKTLAEEQQRLASVRKVSNQQRLLLLAHKHKLDQVEVKRAKLQQTNDTEQAKMNAARGLAENFEERVNQAFLRELQQVRGEAREHPNAAHRFFALMHCRLLVNEIDRLYKGIAL